jgi:hypothetical protein
MARAIRLRYRDVILAAVIALMVDVFAVLAVYLIDLSPLGPLRRFSGPWGLPCLGVAPCPTPCPPGPGPGSEKTGAAR